MHPRLSFLGAAQTVTGSCYLVEHGGRRLLVDCGLFQGSKTLKELNYGPFPFDPAGIDAVLLTHAHIDHSGLVPKLCREGFRGRILATGGTRDLLTYMLPDSGHIQEFEVDQLNRRRRRRGDAPVQPIYTREDAERALRRIDAVEIDAWSEPVPGFRARFWPAGHILGSSSIELEIGGGEGPVRILFSGDLGPRETMLHAAAAAPSAPDYLVVEGTYGDRLRPRVSAEQRRRRLATEVRAAMDAGGNLVIPAFAVERTQELLFDLATLFARGELPKLAVFLDSPLAIRATEVFARHLDPSLRANDLFRHPNFHFLESAEQSKALNRIRSGAVIMAASGMCEAGRIRHHLKAHLWRRECTLLFVGYQAQGTLGRLILDGAPAVRVMGEEIKVAARIRAIDDYSAHADQAELLAWIAERAPVGCATALTHGEPAALACLKGLLLRQDGRPPATLQPMLGSALRLDRSRSPRLEIGAPRVAAPEYGASDWHNDYAAFLLALSDSLRKADTESARAALVRRLKAALAAGT